MKQPLLLYPLQMFILKSITDKENYYENISDL